MTDTIVNQETSLAPEGSRFHWAWGLSLLVLTCLGGWIRWLPAWHDPLWLDELHTAWCTTGAWETVWPRAAAGNQPPLFFWLVSVTQAWSPNPEFGLRIVAWASGTLLIAALGYGIWRTTGSGVLACCLAGLAMLADPLVYYATEARAYSLIQLLVLLQCHTLLCWIQTWGRSGEESETRAASSWVWGGSCCLLSMVLLWTHYVAGLVLVSEWVLVTGLVALAIARKHKSSRRAGVQLGLGTLLVGLSAIPLAVGVQQTWRRREQWSGFTSLESLLAEPMIVWSLVVSGLLVGVWGVTSRFPYRECRSRMGSGLPLALWWMTLGAIVLLDVTQVAPLASPRYALIALPLLLAAVGAGLGRLRPVPRAMAALLLLASLGIPWSQGTTPVSIVWESVTHQSIPRLRAEDWRTPIAETNQFPAAVPLVVFSALIEDEEAFTSTSDEFQAYLRFPVQQGIYPLEPPRRVFVGPTLARNHLNPAILEAAVEQGAVLLLIRYTPGLRHEISQQFATAMLQRAQVAASQPVDVEVQELSSPANLVALVSIQLVSPAVDERPREP